MTFTPVDAILVLVSAALGVLYFDLWRRVWRLERAGIPLSQLLPVPAEVQADVDVPVKEALPPKAKPGENWTHVRKDGTRVRFRGPAVLLACLLAAGVASAQPISGLVRTDDWQVRGVAASTGTGAADSGTPRVAVAYDSIALSTAATATTGQVAVSSGATPSLLAAADANRAGNPTICNEGTIPFFWGGSASVTTATGQQGALKNQGGCVWPEGPGVYKGAIYVIAVSSGGTASFNALKNP